MMALTPADRSRRPTTTACCLMMGLLLLLARASLLPHPALAVEHKGRPFSRMQAATGATTTTTTTKADAGDVIASAASAAAAATSTGTGALAGTLEGARARAERLRPSEKLAFLQNLMRNGGDVDPIEMLQMGLKSSGFKVLLDHVEMQHRIMEQLPMLAAFNGFKQARGRRLSDEETKVHFAQGVQNILDFAKDAFAKIKDPTKTAETIAKMAADPDPVMQDLFRKAQDGDKDAVFELQDRFNDLHFPGVDARVLREQAASHTFDKLLGMPEIMRFIDRDETLSQIFRDPDFLKNGKEFFKTGTGVPANAFGQAFEEQQQAGAATSTTTTTTTAPVGGSLDEAAP